MGIFGELKNKKKTPKQRKTMKWKRGQRVEYMKKHQKELDVEKVALFSKDMLKNKMKNMNNNVNMSNKKRNRKLKRLRHGQREKEAAAADTDEVFTKAKMIMFMPDEEKMTEVTEKPAKSTEVTEKPEKAAAKKGGKGKKTASVTTTTRASRSKPADEDVEMEDDGE